MKSVLLSMVALAALAGAQAAEVVGNNTAVVIRRDNKASASGHQLLCVPVKPFNITGTAAGETQDFALADILPPAVYEGCTVTLNSGTNGAITYTASSTDGWTQYDTQTRDASEPRVAPGEVLWLLNQSDKVTSGQATYSVEAGAPTVFCGEENNANATIGRADAMQSVGNATSSEVSLADLFGTSFQDGDQISRIVTKGDKNYTTYQYVSGKWYCLGAAGGITQATLGDIKVAPGEAMYFYFKSAATSGN